MNKMTLEVCGKELPCRITMGAMLLFKRNMGSDAAAMFQKMEKTGVVDLEETLMFLWCCVKCACKADNVDFEMDFETFICHITPEHVSAWNAQTKAQNKEQKKSEAQP